MATLIQKIGRLAVQTFNRDPSVSNQIKGSYMKQLVDLVSSVSSADLSIEPSLLLQDERQNDSNGLDTRAPVIYLQLYEDADVNVCVFILRKGVQMPMHDHPGMRGLLKVVHGRISVQSYTLMDDNPPTNEYEAIKHSPVERCDQDPPLTLDPDNENLHEIISINGPAAFLDILSPPYGEDVRTGAERDCHYYREFQSSSLDYLNSSADNKTYLMRVSSPSNFWCDQAEYCGPPLKGVIERGKKMQ